MNEILARRVHWEMERVLATGELQYADPPRHARVGIPFAEGGHEVKECGGENRVILIADDSGMWMAHQVEECGGEDRVISTADDFGMGTPRGKEGVSMKIVVAVTSERARERYKESGLWG